MPFLLRSFLPTVPPKMPQRLPHVCFSPKTRTVRKVLFSTVAAIIGQYKYNPLKNTCFNKNKNCICHAKYKRFSDMVSPLVEITIRQINYFYSD